MTELERYRDKYSISRLKLAEASGLDYSQIFRYEKGEREPTISTCLKMKKGFKVLTNKNILIDRLFKETT